MKVFTAPKDLKHTWPEHYMWMGPDRLPAAVRGARAIAQSWELETKNKNLGKEMVGAVWKGAADITLAVNEINMVAEKVWILESGSSRHLVTNASWLEDVDPYVDSCVQPNGDTLNITKKGTFILRVTECGKEQMVKLIDVCYAENVVHNLISYSTLDRKGFALTEKGGRRVLASKNGGRVVFDVDLQRSVLIVHTRVVKRRDDTSEVIMAVLDKEVTKPDDVSIEWLARDPSSGIEFTDRRRVNCLTCAQGKQTKNNRRKKASRTKDASSKQIEHFLVSFEKQFNYRIHLPRMDLGGEYQNVDMFCKKTGVARQRSEARNQGLRLSFWGDAVQYAAYILNRASTNSNTGRVSPIKLLMKQTSPLGEIVDMIVGIGEETKGYRVYLPKDKVVVTTQHVRNIETLDKAQNVNVQKLYLQDDEAEAEEETAGDAAVVANSSKKRSRQRKKKGYTRERHVTRSVARQAEEKMAVATQQKESSNNVVNSVTEMDLKNYREAMRSRLKARWLEAIHDDLRALEENGVWTVVRRPRGDREFGVNYSVMFASVIEMSGVKLIPVLARKWHVPAKRGDVPNAYVKAKKESELTIYIRIPQGMEFQRRSWPDLLSIKDLGPASKFLGMRVSYREEEGYNLDQEVAILGMLKEHGMEFAHGVRTPIGAECNKRQEAGDVKLPVLVHKVSRRMHGPTVADWKLAKRFLRYLSGTKVW
ncbi:mitochondrial protein [Phytophthora palmivora]|uniref:Mitochondrial protein n=1 Tax=Phytophthora palmivora TaxID=4796 RepID=A0A2P4Y4Z0_9STRA|nr:mitochondrial protein [Phytophthora palmivora]